jgi:mono/diheme cytochrome c family protein
MRRAGLLLCLLLTACGKGEMAVQHKFKPFRPSDLFADGAASQTPPAGTVAQGAADGRPVARPAIHCAPCHGRDGDGTGLVQQRGFPAPEPMTADRLRAADDSYLFNVISNGYGVMYPFASRIPAPDRWAIVAYLRALQLSQHAAAAALPPRMRAALEAAPP